MYRSFVLAVAVLCFFVSFVKGKNTVHCSFEKDSCEWKELKTRNCWLISKPTDRLMGMTGFLYFNNSCLGAEIRTKPLSGFFSDSEEEFHFQYYMHGEGDGELIIVDHDWFGPILGNKPHVSFHCKGDRGHQWHHAHVKIPGGSTFMGIVAKARGTFLIAIDNITADSHGSAVPSEQICPRVRLTTSRKTTAPKMTTPKTTTPKTTAKITTKLVTAIQTSRGSPTKRQVKTSRGTSTKQATTSGSLIVEIETTMKRNSQPRITKSVLPSESTTRGATELKRPTTPPAESRTSMATASEMPAGGHVDRQNDFSGDHHGQPIKVEADKRNIRKISIIIGACIGGVVLVVGSILAAYFTYRRIRLTSMYSFKKRALNGNNIHEDSRRF